MTIIHESEVPETEHPGRFMRWLANEDSLYAKNLSVCVIRVMPGETVQMEVELITPIAMEKELLLHKD